MSRGPRTTAWRRRGRVVLAAGIFGAAIASSRGSAPGRDLGQLARELARAAGASAGESVRVDPQDLRWEPSEGALADFVFGRRVLFLGREAGQDSRDVWRARVRVSPEGDVLEVRGAAHDLTNTPLGDDHALVVSGVHAAFATRAYGQEQSITALDLAGEGAQNKTIKRADRWMAAITNLQQTGDTRGVGRLDVTLESPAASASLVLDDTSLAVTLVDADPRRAARRARLDLGSGEVTPASSGLHSDASMHLPKLFSHWVVDTLRAVPWIGPAPIAWLEDRALAARDDYRRLTFRTNGAATDVVAPEKAVPPPLDSSQAPVEEAQWPPPPVASIWKQAEPGEGVWVTPGLSWLRRVPGAAADAPPPFFRTFVRPDVERPYVKVLLVAMDMRQLDLDMEAGVEDPEPLTGPHGTGRIPRDPAIYKRVAAAFNGAFKTEHGHYGMMVHRRVLLPPVPGAATVVVLDDGRVGFGTWGALPRVGGIVGVDDNAIVSFRQNLDPLLDHGQINPTKRNLWGFTLPGKGAQTERSGLCVTTRGQVIYAWGEDVGATALARAMQMGGCDYAMHLDMNPFHTGFLFTAIDDPSSSKKYKSQLLTPAMSIQPDRYVQYSPKDFFYVMVHGVTPPVVPGAGAWDADAGVQPPPHWLPGVWRARIDGPGAGIELLDVESGRTTWRIRAGSDDSPAASPLREFSGDEAKRVLLAVGAGVALEKRPRGIATDGRLAVPLHGGQESGALIVDARGDLSMVRASEAQPLDLHEDMMELPVVLWDGKPQATPSGPAAARAAIGLVPGGRVVIARGEVASFAPLADALGRAGCTRALGLDRGAHANAMIDRAGTAHPPRGRYEESVLYAVAAPLPPRAFHFDPSTLVAQKK